MSDWYRKIKWSPSDRDDFFARLKRSRKYNRAKYLRIQAYHLYQTKTRSNVNAALELVELLLTDYPSRIELGVAHLLRAQCLDRLAQVKDAFSAYKDALDAMRVVPNVRTGAQFGFAFFVIEHSMAESYEDTLKVLDEFTTGPLFPTEQYAYHASRAILLSRLNADERAVRIYAEEALASAVRKHSGLRYHPGLGLVKQDRAPLFEEICRLAARELDV